MPLTSCQFLLWRQKKRFQHRQSRSVQFSAALKIRQKTNFSPIKTIKTDLNQTDRSLLYWLSKWSQDGNGFYSKEKPKTVSPDRASVQSLARIIRFAIVLCSFPNPAFKSGGCISFMRIDLTCLFFVLIACQDQWIIIIIIQTEIWIEEKKQPVGELRKARKLKGVLRDHHQKKGAGIKNAGRKQRDWLSLCDSEWISVWLNVCIIVSLS